MTDLQKHIIADAVYYLNKDAHPRFAKLLELAALEIGQNVENLYKKIEASPGSPWVPLDAYKVGDTLHIEGEHHPRVLIEHSNGVKEFVPVCNGFAPDEDFGMAVKPCETAEEFTERLTRSVPAPKETFESSPAAVAMKAMSQVLGEITHTKTDKLIFGHWNAGKTLNEMSRESGLESATIVMILDRLGLGMPNVSEQSPPPDAPTPDDLVAPIESKEPDPKALSRYPTRQE